MVYHRNRFQKTIRILENTAVHLSSEPKSDAHMRWLPDLDFAGNASVSTRPLKFSRSGRDPCLWQYPALEGVWQVFLLQEPLVIPGINHLPAYK
ncbi:hypothetical protein J6590_096823 [Homalodisca vitripennis]|nr:hypothetical protein J6590_096823 [Homalodisca vitripennis]